MLSGKIIALAATGLALVIVIFVSGLFALDAFLPVSDDTRKIIIEVEPGMTLQQVTQRLAKNRLLKSPRAFLALAWLKGKESQIQVGEFELSPSLSVREILEIVTSGKTYLRPVTIPEGYRITEMAVVFAHSGLAKEEQFIHEAGNPELIASLNLHTENLEGYLFPETYHFGKYTGAKKIVKAMSDTFKQRVLKPEILKRAEEMGMTIHEIITLASLIEKETGLETERKLISSVFHNRLKKKMLLQTDPAVIYAIKNFDGNIRKKDLSVDSPYNTYKYPGLPPGPIASPGMESIIAALNPVESPYLYFVSRQDGSHHFSKTLTGHNRAVRRYQLRGRSRNGR